MNVRQAAKSSGGSAKMIHYYESTGLIPPVDRLYAKNLVTQADGGYLTSLGREATEHAQTMLGFLTSGVAASVQ